jgi:arylsulfatase A-like enzyme
MRYIILLGLIALMSCNFSTTEKQATAKKTTDQPNILFIIADDLGARLSCYGEPVVQSPNMDKLALEGTLFERCYSQVPTCGPSRSSMLSGLYNHEDQSAMWERFPDHENPTLTALPHLLRKNGYFTARVGKIYHYGVPNEIGTPGHDQIHSWDMTVNNDGWDGFYHINNLKKVHRQPDPFWQEWGVAVTYLDPEVPDEEMVDGVGTQEAIRIIESHHPDKTGKPFMLSVGYYSTHPPMIAPKKHWDAIDRDQIKLPEVPENDRSTFPKNAIPLQGPGHNYIPDSVGIDYTQAYYAAIHFVDSEIGKLVDALKANNLDDNTIIVITGDQGFHLGEHDHWHKTTAFEPSQHVPLIIIDPRTGVKGQRVEGLCGLIDLYPTLCDLTGVKPDHKLSGISLKPQLSDASLPTKEWELSQFVYQKHGFSLRTERYRYTELDDGVMLYDLIEDPKETNNLAGKPEMKETEMMLKAKLASIIK